MENVTPQQEDEKDAFFFSFSDEREQKIDPNESFMFHVRPYQTLPFPKVNKSRVT